MSLPRHPEAGANPVPDEYMDEIYRLEAVNAQLRKIIDRQDLLIQEIFVIADTSGDNAEILARMITDTIEIVNHQLGERS